MEKPTRKQLNEYIYIRANINAIEEGQEWIADKYNKGKKKIDDAIGAGSALDTDAQKSVMDGYAKNAKNASLAAQKHSEELADAMAESSASVSDSAADTAASLENLESTAKATTDKISDDFREFYEALSFAKAKGEISDDEYIELLKAKLNSSATYNIAAYKSYWNEVTTAANKCCILPKSNCFSIFKPS